MHRVVVKRREHRGAAIVEVGPWLVSESDAENWAEIFRSLGYRAQLERMHGALSQGGADDTLHRALSSMA